MRRLLALILALHLFFVVGCAFAPRVFTDIGRDWRFLRQDVGGAHFVSFDGAR